MLKNALCINLIFVFAICQGQNNTRDSLISVQPSFDIKVSNPPTPVKIDGQQHIIYELQVSNFSQKSLTITGIEVKDAKDSGIISVFTGDEIIHRVYKPFVENEKNNLATVDPGGFAVVYIESVIQKFPLPVSLYHRITYQSVGSYEEKQFFINGAKTNVVGATPVKLGPRLKGGQWAAIYEPGWERGHRRVIYTVDGVARIPGRFAIDFIKLDDSGRVAFGDNNTITNWYGYDTEVLAVADGVVSSSRDDFSESATLSSHPKYDSHLATGNYVSIKIAENIYVFYEHLKPGSIRVKPGQKVRKGEVIARLGFTGQSTGPHLHLHVSNRDSPLGAEGLPFIFESFTLLGSYPDFKAFGKARWQSKNSIINPKMKNEFPAPNTVIIFN